MSQNSPEMQNLMQVAGAAMTHADPAHDAAMQIQGAVDTRPQVKPAGPPAIAGLNRAFIQRFHQLQKAVQASGGQLAIFSGARDAAMQAQMYKAAVAKYGSEVEAKKHIAAPGKSTHDVHAGLAYGLGDGALAVDLHGDLALAHRLGPQFGIVFPQPNEPWHAEFAGLKR